MPQPTPFDGFEETVRPEGLQIVYSTLTHPLHPLGSYAEQLNRPVSV